MGVSGLETWARPEAEPEAEREKESRRWFRGFDQGRELGRACPHTRVVVVGDRERDIYALLRWQAEHAAEAGLVVRANASRQRQVQVWDPQLQATMCRALASQPDFETPVKTGRAVLIDSQGGKRARARRTVVTELRIGQVALQPPKERPEDGPVTAWVVRVLETNPLAGHQPLEWLLVSSEGGPTAEWAERIVGWYEARWGIEEYFRVLKSGTRIADRRLQEADALVKCLAFDAVTAWRVFSLDRYARDAPDTPDALRRGALCSNDPICAQHAPGESMEQRWLHGAACHGCTLISETSCEMRNDYLDRALVVPVLGLEEAAFFPSAM